MWMTKMNEVNPPQVSQDSTIYLKAFSIKKFSDIETIKMEVSSGNIIVAKITQLANKSLEDTQQAINELIIFVKNLGGSIARLGDERLIIAPPSIKIWKEKDNFR